MAEYGVVLAVITIAVFGASALLAGNITNALKRRRLHHLSAPTAGVGSPADLVLDLAAKTSSQ